MNDSTWRRWTLLLALFALGGLYVAAYVLFVSASHDFIARRQNDRALERIAAQFTDVPSTLRFARGEKGVEMLGAGWHAPEPEGVWSSAKDAWLWLRLRKMQDNIAIKVEATPFVARHHSKISVRFDVDGFDLGESRRTRLNPNQPFMLCIPAEYAKRNPLPLHLRFDSLASPEELGLGPDERPLGLLLTSVELRQGCVPGSR